MVFGNILGLFVFTYFEFNPILFISVMVIFELKTLLLLKDFKANLFVIPFISCGKKNVRAKVVVLSLIWSIFLLDLILGLGANGGCPLIYIWIYFCIFEITYIIFVSIQYQGI